jgi:hypothetical protein
MNEKDPTLKGQEGGKPSQAFLDYLSEWTSAEETYDEKMQRQRQTDYFGMQGFKPEELTAEDEHILDRIRAGAVTEEEFKAYATGVRESANSSRAMFLRLATTESTLVFEGKKLTEANEKNAVTDSLMEKLKGLLGKDAHFQHFGEISGDDIIDLDLMMWRGIEDGTVTEEMAQAYKTSPRTKGVPGTFRNALTQWLNNQATSVIGSRQLRERTD